MVDAMPAHSEGHHSGCAAIRRQNAETNVNSTSAGWERHRSSNQPPTARFPVRREGCAERTDLQGSGGYGDDHDARLGRVHSEQDSRRLQQKVPENDR